MLFDILLIPFAEMSGIEVVIFSKKVRLTIDPANLNNVHIYTNQLKCLNSIKLTMSRK